MMNSFQRIFVRAFALVLIFASSSSSSALAHDNEPRLEISSERMNPGGVIEVRGVYFEFEELITLALVGEDNEILLGGISADTEGVFLQLVTLPTELSEGNYYIHAKTDDHEIQSPALIIQGPPILDEGDDRQDLRDEEHELLAPMPTALPVNSSATSFPSTSPSKEADPSLPLSVIVITIVAVVGIIVFMTWGQKSKN